nr:MAG TPA: hypothetical protein [Caudoviricetes sp.]
MLAFLDQIGRPLKSVMKTLTKLSKIFLRNALECVKAVQSISYF